MSNDRPRSPIKRSKKGGIISKTDTPKAKTDYADASLILAGMRNDKAAQVQKVQQQLVQILAKRNGIDTTTAGLNDEQTKQSMTETNTPLALTGTATIIPNKENSNISRVAMDVISQDKDGNYGSLTLIADINKGNVSNQVYVQLNNENPEQLIEIRKWDKFIADLRSGWKEFTQKAMSVFRKGNNPQAKGIDPVYQSVASIGGYQSLPAEKPAVYTDAPPARYTDAPAKPRTATTKTVHTYGPLFNSKAPSKAPPLTPPEAQEAAEKALATLKEHYGNTAKQESVKRKDDGTHEYKFKISITENNTSKVKTLTFDDKTIGNPLASAPPPTVPSRRHSGGTSGK